MFNKSQRRETCSSIIIAVLTKSLIERKQKSLLREFGRFLQQSKYERDNVFGAWKKKN